MVNKTDFGRDLAKYIELENRGINYAEKHYLKILDSQLNTNTSKLLKG